MMKLPPLPGLRLFKATKESVQRNGNTYDTLDVTETDDIEEAYLISSKSVFDDNEHCPVLDLDLSAKLIPSSTEGHFHLYIKKPISWKKYKLLLLMLAECGIIEHGFASASIRRGYSAVRLPWIKRESPRPPKATPAQEQFTAWLDSKAVSPSLHVVEAQKYFEGNSYDPPPLPKQWVDKLKAVAEVTIPSPMGPLPVKEDKSA